YVDFKEPAVLRILRATKNSTSTPTMIHVSVSQAGTKLSFNLQSQKLREPASSVSRLVKPRVQRDCENSSSSEGVN
ncbi:MAG: hypothetical protein ACR2NX_12185, partial [Chthoniobacterales bacterium]